MAAQTQETWKHGWEAVGMMRGGGHSENFDQEHLPPLPNFFHHLTQQRGQAWHIWGVGWRHISCNSKGKKE